ncbi:monooxygenase, partial [Haematobacter massiliensis]
LAAAPDAEQGFSDFVRLRRARVARLVAAANANARNYHLTGASRQAAHMVLRVGGMLAPSAAIGRFDWIYRYDPVGASRMGG